MSLPVGILDEDCMSCSNASHLSIARLEFHVAVQPYGEQSIRWHVKTGFAHPSWDVNKTDA
ncbi:hypothetical protein AC628_32115 [Bradyrhizobium sp. NAS96.2]|nr:hypothetical protein AC628_32115 [Bradyrhizobium sp. NAS96.2]